MERHVKKYPSKWQNQYTEEFKRHVCEELIRGPLGAKALERKYQLGNSRLVSWLKQLGYEYKKPERLPLVVMRKPTKPNQEQDALINKLKRQLEDAKLQAEMYRRIIEKAEQELKIKIRKKINTK
jgi:transposase-like protein